MVMAQAVPPAPPQKIDLTIPEPCETQASTDDNIIVCARRGEPSRYRIPLLTPYQSGLPKAEFQLGNGTSLSADTEQVDVGGWPSNRAMIRLKFKF
jgi:hypothetical protein